MPWTDLLERNRRWAAELTAADPDFFRRLSSDHRPATFFVGCSDARVPADAVTGSEVGQLFVHRNIGNQVNPSDASLSAGLVFAIEALGVEDVIVCGHHGCGGVRAALLGEAPPQVDAWVHPLRMLARVHAAELAALGERERLDRLVELNVVEQVRALTRHPSVRGAWASGRALRVHGWVFDMPRGLLLPRVRVDGDETWHIDGAEGLGARLTAG